jgi:hypothetical protein
VEAFDIYWYYNKRSATNALGISTIFRIKIVFYVLTYKSMQKNGKDN